MGFYLEFAHHYRFPAVPSSPLPAVWFADAKKEVRVRFGLMRQQHRCAVRQRVQPSTEISRNPDFRELGVRRRGEFVVGQTGLPLSFLNLAYVRQGVYFWAYGTPGASIFGVFHTPSLSIFGVIFGLVEAMKMYSCSS